MATLTGAPVALHVAAPIATALVAVAFSLFGPEPPPGRARGRTPRRLLCRRLVVGLLVALFAAQGLVTALTAAPTSDVQARVLHVVGLGLVWAAESGRSLSHWELGSVSLTTAAFEVPPLVLALVRPHGVVGVARLVLQASRIGLVGYLVLDAGVGLATGASPDAEAPASEPLLAANGDTANGYGAVPPQHSKKKGADNQDDGDDDDDMDPYEQRLKKRREERLRETGGWLNYIKDFGIFWPILNPMKRPRVLAYVAVLGLCIVGARILNVAVPRQLAIVTEKLLAGQPPYKELAVWLALSLAGSSTGLGLVQRLAKIPVRQFAYRQMSDAAFRHVMSLSMDFHSDRDTGEILKAVDQGSAITNMLDWLVIDIVPAVVDMVVGALILYRKFNVYFLLCMVAAAALFFVVEVYTSASNRDYRRKSQKLAREAAKKMHQAVQNWQTVAYFDMFDYEGGRYRDSIRASQAMSRRYNTRDAVSNSVLQALVPVTFFVIAAMAVNEIVHGRSTAGDFVFLLQYWGYLVYPLRNLSWQYRFLMQDLVDAERLLELLQTRPSVPETPGAVDLPRARGHVTFDRVGFAYDARKHILTDISIDARPGQTVAFVGATGAGKSSIIKLLHRFYDVSSGSIRIDGHDIRDVTLGSLRHALGVVPQDPMLFNATVMDNVRYARIDATDADVFAACRAAAIHDKILSFADGYATRVGENGVKLSGGEAQRVAIARVFLKNPPILILDEATSAVDTATEVLIQSALDTLRKQRTTFVIAHRLSTIVSADIIMVVDEGRIVERGTHHDLLAVHNGRYRKLWEIQSMAVPGRAGTVEDLIEMDKDQASKSTE